MPGISKKKLSQVEKTLEAVFADDEDTLAEVQKSLAGFRAAIEKGETVTMDDITEVLGEVVLEKSADEPGEGTGGGAADTDGDGEVDPVSQVVAPAMLGLYKQLFDDKGSIKKGVSASDAQGLFDATFQGIVKKLLPEFDAAIEAAAEAAAIELGKGNQVNLGKSGKKPVAAEEDEDCEDEDMQKLLKSLGVSGSGAGAVIQKMQGLQRQVEALQEERDLEIFGKQAEDIGEGRKFGATLLKLHKLDPKLADEVKKRLNSKNELLRKGGEWSKEIGAGEGEEAGMTAYAQLSAKANEMVQKGEKDDRGRKLTFAKAFTIATERHPDLYQEYQAEEAAKRRR